MRENTRETFRDDKDRNGDWIEGTGKAEAERCRTRFMALAALRARERAGTWEVEVRKIGRHEYAVILWER